MSYTVLARRYRSRDFGEVVGQDPIARTLTNAIATDRTAHAYLFCGTRGVGKTSMARIFARALNATDDLAQKDEIADAIGRGDDLDVIEIDGASNRGINEARDLIAAAGLSPARCPYKIYIIDEVHMLTREAFNALLKTMEEPPAHVKFILCTTEASKVPATIQSRCQRFDFRPIPTTQIAEHLRVVLKSEKVKADDEVIMQVAQLGNGSMRDALSLLDRLLASGEKKLTSSLMEQMLGLPDIALVHGLAAAIASGDARATLQQGARLLGSGTSLEQALDRLVDYYRDLLVLATCGADSDLVALSVDARTDAAELASKYDASGLVHLIAICEATSRNCKGSVAARAIFDAALVRLAMSEQLADIPSLLEGSASGGSTTPAGKKKAPVAPVSPVAPAPQPRVEASDAPIADAPPATAAGGGTAQTLTEVKTTPPVSSGSLAANELWPAVLAAARQAPLMQARLDDFVFESFDGTTVHLSIHESGRARARFMSVEMDKVEAFISKVADARIKVRLDLPAEEVAPPVSSDAATNEVQQHPHVKKAMELFDAVVVEVKDQSNPE